MCIGGLELQRKALKADFMTEQSTRIPFHSASPKVGIILLWYPLFTQPFIFRDVEAIKTELMTCEDVVATGRYPYTGKFGLLGENDWAHSWQKYYKPMAVGERLWIVPEWERGQEMPQGKVPVYLNPGLTFGTGSHSSTRLCLMGLEEYTVPGQPVLDLGCGSGILSIAALNLGASAAVAVDIDPKAVDVAYENAALNGIGKDRYTVRAGDVLSDKALAAELGRQRYPLVLANIVADVIIPLSAKAGDYLTEDGVFLCSGIIDTRAGEVQAALERNGLKVFRRREEKGWVSLAARKG